MFRIASYAMFPEILCILRYLPSQWWMAHDLDLHWRFANVTTFTSTVLFTFLDHTCFSMHMCKSITIFLCFIVLNVTLNLSHRLKPFKKVAWSLFNFSALLLLVMLLWLSSSFTKTLQVSLLSALLLLFSINLNLFFSSLFIFSYHADHDNLVTAIHCSSPTAVIFDSPTGEKEAIEKNLVRLFNTSQ